MPKFQNHNGPPPGVIHAEFQAIEKRLAELGLRLFPDEARAVKENIRSGGAAWKELRRADSAEAAHGLVEAVMHAQVRHYNSDYDRVNKLGLSEEELARLRDRYMKKIWRED